MTTKNNAVKHFKKKLEKELNKEGYTLNSVQKIINNAISTLIDNITRISFSKNSKYNGDKFMVTCRLKKASINTSKNYQNTAATDLSGSLIQVLKLFQDLVTNTRLIQEDTVVRLYD